MTRAMASDVAEHFATRGTVDDGTAGLATDETEEFATDGAEDFLSGFDALAQAVRRARGANSRAPDASLTLSQYGLLEGLADRGAARVQDLAAHAGITASTATRILDALERRGIVERARSWEDRRVVAVSLTQAGEELFRTEREWLRGRQRAFYAALPAAERELAPALLLRLAALIDELAGRPVQ
jgi:DNA-binding MarR family transcriptional regulator